ncbi:tolB protein precursor [Minicystis rosea]|nr:tolB protein precursor [Minicystis rosea]
MPSLRLRLLLSLVVPLIACDDPKRTPSEPVAPRASTQASAAPTTSTASTTTPAPTTAVGRGVDAMLGLRAYRQLTLSRDGAHVAYSLAPDPLGAPRQRSVFVIDRRSPDATPRRVTGAGTGTSSDRSPAFSPDGKRLAFVSEAPSEPPKIWIVDLDGRAAPRSFVMTTRSIVALRFSPDGARLVYLATESVPNAAPASPAAPTVHTMGDPAPSQRIHVLDLATGDQRAVSPPDLHVHEYDFTPDGQSFIGVVSPRAPRPDWFRATLQVFTGSTARILHKPARQLGDPQVSPDGKLVAFIEGLMSDEGVTGGDLWVVPFEGGTPTNLTRGRKGTIVAARFRPDARSLVVDEIADGRYALSSIPIDGGAGETLFEAEAAFWAFDMSADGQTVTFLHSSFDTPQSIWSGAPRAPTPITSTRQTFEKAWGATKSLHARSDTYSIQSFLIAPPIVEPGRRYPLVVYVHGGPAASAVAAPSDDLALAADGNFVLRPNPRGSLGQGEAFQEANVGDFGFGDLRDIRASVRAAIEAAPIDPERVGITGWSYGGYMTMWAVTQTSEFRAAVAGAGIADWTSYYGQTDTTGWMPPYFGGSVYDKPEAYAKSSPILFIKQAKTPTLMIVGENDVDCPAPQSRQFWQALSEQGTPAELVVYPGEPHGFSQPAHRRDRAERMAAWFRKHLPPR